MRTNQLSKFTIKELKDILKSVDEMILIPIINKFDLNKKQLKKMQNELLTELKTR